MASGATIASSTAEIVVRMPIVSRFVRTRRPNAPRSPAAQTPDSDGNAASEIAMPTSATGTLWKLRAKLTAVMDPAASVDATLVKNRNVIGSIGWASILGSISQPNSWSAGIRSRIRGRIRTGERVMPTTRMPRWSDAPRIAPTAAAKIPMRSWSSTVPATIPTL